MVVVRSTEKLSVGYIVLVSLAKKFFITLSKWKNDHQGLWNWRPKYNYLEVEFFFIVLLWLIFLHKIYNLKIFKTNDIKFFRLRCFLFLMGFIYYFLLNVIVRFYGREKTMLFY